MCAVELLTEWRHRRLREPVDLRDLARQTLDDEVGSVGRLCDADPLPKAADRDQQPKPRYPRRDLVRTQRDRDPDVAGLHRRREAARHDADDHSGLLIEEDRLANDARIAAEAPPPQSVPDDGDSTAGAFFLASEAAPQAG
jgi:hypothetical protein